MNIGMQLVSLSRALVMVAIVAVYMVETTSSTPLLALYAISAATFVATTTVIVGWVPVSERIGRSALYLEIALATVLNAAAAYVENGGLMRNLYAPIIVTIFIVSAERGRLVHTAVLLSGFLLAGLPDWLEQPLRLTASEIGVQSLMFVFFGSAGHLVRSLEAEKERSDILLKNLEQSRAALERVNRQLQETAARQQEHAVLQERQRLAREIHDGVAHGLTALVVQLQAARRLLDRSPEQSGEALVRCEDLAREALQETRQAVRALHPSGLEQISSVEALRRLGRDFGAATGIRVTVSADGAAERLPTDIARLEQLYRIFQECLTNAHRHGRAQTVTAELAAGPESLCLTIVNDGCPPEQLEPGVGMKSMRERARSLGGDVAFEPGPAGLTVRVTVPLGEGSA